MRSLSPELTKAEDASAPPPPRWRAVVSKSHRKTRRSRTKPAVSARGRQVVARRDAGDARQNSHLTRKIHAAAVSCTPPTPPPVATCTSVCDSQQSDSWCRGVAPGECLTFNILIKKKKKRKGPVLLLEVESVGCKCSGHIHGVSKYSLMRGWWHAGVVGVGGGLTTDWYTVGIQILSVCICHMIKFCSPSTENKN